ncbi:MAG: hypothetical protein ABI462_01025 [Ignavibacteria bacterium]
MSLFPGTDYNYGIMKNLIFELNKLLERFIVVEKAGQDKLIETKNLLSFLNEKNLPKLFIKKFDLIERSYDNNYFNRSNLGIKEYYSFWHDALILKHNVSIYTKSDHSLYDSFP